MYGADCLSAKCRYFTSEFQYSLQEIRVIIATQRIIVRIKLRHIVKGVNTVLYIKSTLINMLPLPLPYFTKGLKYMKQVRI